MKKIAVILFSMGGPDSPEAVRPFLFNLFNDPAILRIQPVRRRFLARAISFLRTPHVRTSYEKIGGSSPLLKNTEEQAYALERELNRSSFDPFFRTFISMRYWKPFSSETARKVKEFNPDEIILLPLYPQFSTTTTQSSLEDWEKSAEEGGLTAPTKTIPFFPNDQGFIRAMAHLTRGATKKASEHGLVRVLFSAHGLPEEIIRAGDPYAAHCRITAEALRKELSLSEEEAVLCFQSRVGFKKWLAPSTKSEIIRAGKDGASVVVVPIAFVSDHSETLVEINIDYRRLAKKSAVPFFSCVPAVGASPEFIGGLAQRVRDVRMQEHVKEQQKRCA